MPPTGAQSVQQEITVNRPALRSLQVSAIQDMYVQRAKQVQVLTATSVQSVIIVKLGLQLPHSVSLARSRPLQAMQAATNVLKVDTVLMAMMINPFLAQQGTSARKARHHRSRIHVQLARTTVRKDRFRKKLRALLALVDNIADQQMGSSNQSAIAVLDTIAKLARAVQSRKSVRRVIGVEMEPKIQLHALKERTRLVRD